MSEFNLESLKYSQNIISVLAGLRPEKSLSFMLTDEGVEAVKEMMTLTDAKMPGNMPKLKEAALQVLAPLTEFESAVPRNVNLTEYEIKAMAKVQELVEKAVE